MEINLPKLQKENPRQWCVLYDFVREHDPRKASVGKKNDVRRGELKSRHFGVS